MTRFEPGQKVRLRKGAKVHTMYPGKPDYWLARSQVVKVHHMIGEYVRWPGSGGYWCQAHSEDAELIN